MKLRFTGQYNNGATSITICGVTFAGREPSDVEGAEAQRRLGSHPEFEHSEAQKPRRRRKASN